VVCIKLGTGTKKEKQILPKCKFKMLNLKKPMTYNSFRTRMLNIDIVKECI
jgi:hypothetical protein